MSIATQIAPEDTATIPPDVHRSNGPGEAEAISSEDRILWISRRLWRRRRQLLWMAGVGALAALVVGLLTPNEYKSTARLMPPENQGGAAGLAAVANRFSASDLVFGGDLFSAQGNGALFLGILRSRTAQELAVEVRMPVGNWRPIRKSSRTAKAASSRSP
jgi:hypothetical protein